MNIRQIIEYIFHTPLNTNKAILTDMLEQLILSHGGSLDPNPDQPETPDSIIYDGGVEE